MNQFYYTNRRLQPLTNAQLSSSVAHVTLNNQRVAAWLSHSLGSNQALALIIGPLVYCL